MALVGPLAPHWDWTLPQERITPNSGNLRWGNVFPKRLMNRLPINALDVSGDNLALLNENPQTPVIMKDLWAADEAGVSFPAGQLWAVVGVFKKPNNSDHQIIAYAVPGTLAAGYAANPLLPSWPQVGTTGIPSAIGTLRPQNWDDNNFGNVAASARNAMRPDSIIWRRPGHDGGGVYSVPMTGGDAWYPQCWNQRVWRFFLNDPNWGLASDVDRADHTIGPCMGIRNIRWSIVLHRVTVLTTDALSEGRDTETVADSLTTSKIQILTPTSTVLWEQTLSWGLDWEATYDAGTGDYQGSWDELHQEYTASGSVDVSASALLAVGDQKSLRIRLTHEGRATSGSDSGDEDGWKNQPPTAGRPDRGTVFEGGPFADSASVCMYHPSYTLQASPRVDVPFPFSLVGPGGTAPGGYLAAWV